ncbi:unnamed protein product [Closterium sp. NIES-65]|nr:unnamed protein product [Closterium sp. NIES-65]
MAGHDGDEVLAGDHALNLTAPFDTKKHHEQTVDVVDLLPGPIWHIIFRHVLLGGSHEGRRMQAPPPCCLLPREPLIAPRESLIAPCESLIAPGESLIAPRESLTAAREYLIAAREYLIAAREYLIAAREYLIAAREYLIAACEYLIAAREYFIGAREYLIAAREYLISARESLIAAQQDLEPMTRPLNRLDPAPTRPSGALSVFLKHAPHAPLNFVLGDSRDLRCLGPLLGPSARSLTSLGLGLKEPPPGTVTQYRIERKDGMIICTPQEDVGFIQLHELVLASSRHGSGSTTLEFKLTAARAITVCFEKALLLRCAMPASLKSFSAAAECLVVDCTCKSPPSLDSLSLIGRSQLLVSSLPLAAAKSAHLNGPNNRPTKGDWWNDLPCSDLESQLAVTDLLSSIAPTVETLVLRYGWPLEGVRVEWNQLRHLSIGMKAGGRGAVQLGQMGVAD